MSGFTFALLLHSIIFLLIILGFNYVTRLVFALFVVIYGTSDETVIRVIESMKTPRFITSLSGTKALNNAVLNTARFWKWVLWTYSFYIISLVILPLVLNVVLLEIAIKAQSTIYIIIAILPVALTVFSIISILFDALKLR